mgnify:CR=1 FL=1
MVQEDSYAFIINPNAGKKKTRKKWESILEPILKRENIDFKPYFTEKREHAMQLAQQAVLEDNFDNIIAVGGDGTFHEVINGILDDTGNLIKNGIKTGIICAGTGSDFIKTVGIPFDLEKSLEIILEGNTRILDVLKGNLITQDNNPIQKFSINVADAGLGGEVVDMVNRSKKIFGGKFTFMWAELKTMLKYKHKPTLVYLDDKEPVEIDLIAIFFGNCIFNGGGLRAATRAVPDDGLIDVFWLEGIRSKLKLITNLVKLYKDDESVQALLEKFEGFVHYNRYKKARIEPVPNSGAPDILIDFDGELVGKAPLEIEIVPKIVNVFSPTLGKNKKQE